MKLILVLFSLFWAAFFSCSEMVLLSLLKFDIKKILTNDKYNKLLSWLENPSLFMTGILAWNNIFSMSFGSIYSLYIFSIFPETNKIFVNIFIFITSSIIFMVFAEVIPKNLGRLKSRVLIFYIYKPLFFFMKILSPFIFILKFFERIFFNKNKNKTKFTMDDIHHFVGFMEEKGLIEESAEDMIHSYLDLRVKKVTDIMIHISEVDAVNIDDSNVLEKAQRFGRSRIPVYKNDINNIIGILYSKDLVKYVFNEKFDLNSILRNSIFFDKNETLDSAFKMFQKTRTHIAMVRNENDIIGLITMEDILEEFIGEISDEYDVKRGLK